MKTSVVFNPSPGGMAFVSPNPTSHSSPSPVLPCPCHLRALFPLPAPAPGFTPRAGATEGARRREAQEASPASGTATARESKRRLPTSPFSHWQSCDKGSRHHRSPDGELTGAQATPTDSGNTQSLAARTLEVTEPSLSLTPQVPCSMTTGEGRGGRVSRDMPTHYPRDHG